MRTKPTDPDFLGATQAMRRAAAQALRLARLTHTPFYVIEEGRIVDLTRRSVKRKAPGRK